MAEEKLARTPLYEVHKSLGAKLTPFAGYDMPVQYSAGIIAEHRHTRAKVSLFDVSHMGQVVLNGADIAGKFERLVPADIVGLRSGRVRYTMFTNERGGILDDLMVAKDGEVLRLVVNASRKVEDLALMRSALGEAAVTYLEDRALIALQGPAAASVLARLARGVEAMAFMAMAPVTIDGIACFVTRSGYTGEDGYEISVPGAEAERLAQRLLAEPEVAPAGLGARDTLRLEAGLCLYGNDIDETTTPVEADLAWTIQKRRREEGGFPGDGIIQRELTQGTARRRVGIKPEGRQIARDHTPIIDAAAAGHEIGMITSGGFSPSLEGAIAMGYVPASLAVPGAALRLSVRGAERAAQISALPFVPHRYHTACR
ncbi:MAG TPA: glycine cleavage system aminomethyltransferase GcvT [Stellaceae bacterium]|jgi:aminomethyltransferase|nr:glycine cleavage system aminomethyltransferase GcvT [Stellaceae bacterium]